MLISLLNVAGVAFSQPQNDYSMQFKINMEKKISRSFSTSVYYQNSFNQNATEMYYNFIDAGIEYKLNRNFTMDARYRFVKIRNRDNFYDDRNLIYTDIMYAKGFGRFGLLARARFQRQFYGGMNNENPVSYRDYNRTKLQLKYRINYYWSPYVSLEAYYPFNHPVRKTIDQWRQTAGVFYTINEQIKIEAYYQLQQLTNRKNKNHTYVTALNFYYKF